MFRLTNFIKSNYIAILRPNLPKLSRSAVWNIMFMINELYLLWVPNFIELGIFFIFGTKFPPNVEIYTCFNVEYVLLDPNFDFLGGCCWLLLVTWWLLMVTARYRSLLFVPAFGRNVKISKIFDFIAKSSSLQTYTFATFGTADLKSSRDYYRGD